MSNILTRSSVAGIVKIGLSLEIAGIAVLIPTLIFHHPLVMVSCIPLGAALLVLDWIGCLATFIRVL